MVTSPLKFGSRSIWGYTLYKSRSTWHMKCLSHEIRISQYTKTFQFFINQNDFLPGFLSQYINPQRESSSRCVTAQVCELQSDWRGETTKYQGQLPIRVAWTNKNQRVQSVSGWLPSDFVGFHGILNDFHEN